MDLKKVPESVKTVFDKFPLVEYGPADLPNIKEKKSKKSGTVYVDDDSECSIYPESVRLITTLKLAGILDKFEIVTASIHASPIKSLPYIYLTPQKGQRTLYPHTKSFYDWLRTAAVTKLPEFDHVKLRPVLSLIEVRLRDAYLMTLYGYGSNYNNIVLRHMALKYSSGETAVPSLLPRVLAYTTYLSQDRVLRRNNGPLNDTVRQTILTNASEALHALDTLCANHSDLGVLDAAIYGYVWTIMSTDLRNMAGSAEAELRTMVKQHKSLVSLATRVERELTLKPHVLVNSTN
ncbi:hypothetical protein V1512DRAFT_258355 [Lipomyces arxii]|uniref:uncharacterized protein n=1 Tax=Lipomyces arxii TaxID=56418 RepID=UPI0034CE91E4